MKTIELDTIIKVDSLISNIAASVAPNSKQESFLTKPTYSKPKRNTVMKSKADYNTSTSKENTTARLYEMSMGTVSESFLNINDGTNLSDIEIDKRGIHEKDLIVILSDDIEKNELSAITNKFSKRLKLVIHYGTNSTIKSIFERFTQIISVSSLQKAVNKSYLLAQNGQTIFLPRANSQFDFFSNIDFA